MARLREFYRKEVVPQLMKQLGVTNPMAVPRLVKITLNMGVGEALADKKVLESAMADLTKISGQKPIACKARTSVASFKVRDGVAIGCIHPQHRKPIERTGMPDHRVSHSTRPISFQKSASGLPRSG